jgi:hypothetical protein
MPIRLITRPPDVQIVDPVSKATTAGAVITFGDVVQRLLSGPRWTESLRAMRAQGAVIRAMEGPGAVALAEEDWKTLRDCAETPMVTLFDAQGGLVTVAGLGYHPAIACQLVPLLLAITTATTGE